MKTITRIQGLVFALAVMKIALAPAPTVGKNKTGKLAQVVLMEGGLAGSDGIPGTSGPESGPGSSSTRGSEEVCLSRHNGTSCLDEDNYSSYLTLVATISVIVLRMKDYSGQ